MQMVVDEAITEALEADNLVLQNMASSKYVHVPFALLLPHISTVQGYIA